MHKIKHLSKRIWLNGSTEPTQRIGLIILGLGLLSLFFYAVQSPSYYSLMDILFDPDYYPNRRDSLFYKLYIYFIPLGLVLSWGYPLLQKIKSWVLKEAPKDKFIQFEKRNELTNFIRKNWDLRKGKHKPALGYVSRVLSPNESYREALELGLINSGDQHVLHVDVLLITEQGEELVFAPCESLGADLQVGDFVMLATLGNADAQDWHYVLIAKLKPIYNVTKKGWVIDSDYIVK